MKRYTNDDDYADVVDTTGMWWPVLIGFIIILVGWGILGHMQQNEKYQQHLAKHVGRETHFAPKCNWCKWDAEDKFLNGEIEEFE